MIIEKNDYIKLSPSALNKFIRCPRCFYLEKRKGIKTPRGIFPSLPSGMHSIIESYFDRCRKHGNTPLSLKSIPFEPSLVKSQSLVDNWRNYKKTALIYEDKILGAKLSGALDDCILIGGKYVPLDYKTKGFALKEGCENFYQTQMDSYCLILEAKGYHTTGFAYLLYYYPKEIDYSDKITFNVQPIKIETSIENAKKVFESAVRCLRGKIPKAHKDCEHCKYVKSRINWLRRIL